MPDSLNIATQQPAAFYHRHIYQPAHPDGLTDTLPGAVTSLKPLEAYPSVADRQGIAPETYTHTPAHSSTMIALIVVSFLLIAFALSSGSNFFKKISNGLWQVKRTKNNFDEHTTNEGLLKMALIAVSLIMEGIVIYASALEWMPGAMQQSMAVLISASVGIAVALYAFQTILTVATGFIFAEKVDTHLWLQGFNSVQIFLGLTLTPVALIMLFAPEMTGTMAILSACLYIVGKFVFFAKSIRIFYKNLFQYVYFLLYLCAVEIAPLTFIFNRAVIF